MAVPLLRQGKLLEYATLGWNIMGVVVLIFITPNAHSVALIAFGFDTLLEIGASTIVIWELNGTNGERQKRALRLLSIAFFLLGVYLLIQSTFNLIYRIHSSESLPAIIWLLLTFVVMMLLASKKTKVGKLMNNQVLLTEGRVTLVDAALAAIVLISMLFTAWLGWWWADIAGGFILMGYCFWEAKHAWQ